MHLFSVVRDIFLRQRKRERETPTRKCLLFFFFCPEHFAWKRRRREREKKGQNRTTVGGSQLVSKVHGEKEHWKRKRERRTQITFSRFSSHSSLALYVALSNKKRILGNATAFLCPKLSHAQVALYTFSTQKTYKAGWLHPDISCTGCAEIETRIIEPEPKRVGIKTSGHHAAKLEILFLAARFSRPSSSFSQSILSPPPLSLSVKWDLSSQISCFFSLYRRHRRRYDSNWVQRTPIRPLMHT